jgi:hypothetical protein
MPRRDAEVRRRGGPIGTVRGGLQVTLAAVLLAAAALCFGGGGSATASPAGYARPRDTTSAAPEGDTVCTPHGVGVTCTGTYSGNYAYDPMSSTGTYSSAPTVTVSQVTNLTHQVVNVSWANFMPSDNAGLGTSTSVILNGVTVMECKGAVVDGRQVPPIADGAYGTTSDCYDLLGGANSTYGPANMVFGYSSDGGMDVQADRNGYPLSCELPGSGPTCGTGSVQFQVEENLQNSFLGCDDDTSALPCYLVVVPNWGGDDGNSAIGPGDPGYPTDPQAEVDYTASCGNHSYDGTYFTANGYGYGTQQFWNTSCSWNDRFVIPLSFAPSPTQFCPSNDYEFNAEGSPDLEQAMQQWLPSWCTSSQGKVDFDYNSGVNEYTARSDFLNGGGSLESSTDAALVTDPASSRLAAGSSRKFTYAPVANTGIAIAYYLDDIQTGQQITNLKLDARLVAKLLTNSYSYAFNECEAGQTTQTQTCDPAVAGNPQNILQDPEFYQLNPEYTPADFPTTNGDGDDDTAPLVLAGSSDMTFELTRWLEADPDAAAFLAGEPDPWGMHVNSYFKTGQTFPIAAYNAALDPGFTQSYVQAQAGQPPHWEATMQNVWNPVSSQDDVDSSLLAYQSSGLTFNYDCLNPGDTCGDPGVTAVYGPSHNGAEVLGARTLFAVVDTGDSGAYQFPTAELVNPAGNAVGPTTDGMAAALASMKTNPDKITQYQDFSSTSPDAYPLTEVQYAMVPTCGLSSSKTRAISNFLNDVANSQLIGTSTGELPSFGGYLPLTTAQQAQDAAAAQQVSTQSCTSPPPDTTVSGKNPGNNGVSGGSGNGGGSTGSGTGTPSGTPRSAGVPSGSRSLLSTSPAVKATPSTEPVGLGMKGADDGSLAKVMLPIALILGALLVLGGPFAYAAGTSGGLSFRKRGKGAAAGAAAATDAGAGAGTGAGTATGAGMAGAPAGEPGGAGGATPDGAGAGDESAAGDADD